MSARATATRCRDGARAGRAWRADVPRSAHARVGRGGTDARPGRGARGPGRARACPSSCRCATNAWRRRRSRSSAAAPRSWRWTSSTTPVTGLTVQACGDAHVANFGTFATPERNVVFDINDFDETDRGPWEWDVKRLATSLHVVAREHGFRRSQRDQVVLEAVRVYREYVDQYRRDAHARRLVRPHHRRRPRRALPEALPRPGATRRHPRVAQGPPAGRGAPHDRPRGSSAFIEDPPIVVHLDDARCRAWTTSRRWSPTTGSRSPTSGVSCSTASAWSTWPAGSSGSAAWAPGAGCACSRRSPGGGRAATASCSR